MADLSLEQERSDYKMQDRRDLRQQQTRSAPERGLVSSRMVTGLRSITKSFMLVLALMLLLQAIPGSQALTTRPVNSITEEQQKEFKVRFQQRLRDYQLNQA